MSKSFETKDSGERKIFSSGMVRDTAEGKTLWHLVAAGPMLKRWAELLTRGAEKYTPNNWMKASGQGELDRFRESAFRHFAQWYNGETDEDHAAAVMFNINGAEYVSSKQESAPLGATAVSPSRPRDYLAERRVRHGMDARFYPEHDDLTCIGSVSRCYCKCGLCRSVRQPAPRRTETPGTFSGGWQYPGGQVRVTGVPRVGRDATPEEEYDDFTS